LNLRTLAFTLAQGAQAKSCEVLASGRPVESSFKQQEDGTVSIALANSLILKDQDSLNIRIQIGQSRLK
jgi:hypothetical protein